MSYPTLKVEIAFDHGPYIASPTWTEVTADVVKVSIHRGRSNDWDDSFVSTATVVLNNNHRKYDPENALSPYVSPTAKLKPRRQIQISGVIGSTTYPMYRGFINGFPVSWENVGKQSTVTVDCFDVLALMSTTALKGDLAEIYTRSLLPVHYYRCSDPSGTLTLKDLGSGNKPMTYLAYTGKTPVSHQNLGLGLSGTSLDVADAQYETSSTTTPSTTGDLTISMWTGSSGAKERSLFYIFNDSGYYFKARVSSDGYLWFENTTGSTYNRKSKSNGFDTPVPHHLLFIYKKSDGVARIYVDGADQTDLSIGGDLAGINMFPTAKFGIYSSYMQEVSVFNKVLSATEISNMYTFGNGSQTEVVATRLARLMALSGETIGSNDTHIPSAMYDVASPTTASISGVPEPSSQLIDALLQAQQTEGGWLFVKNNGVLKATDRLYFAGKTSLVTFTDIGTSGFRYRGDIDISYEGDNIRNDIVVKYGGNSSSLSSGLYDPDSIYINGRHTLTVDSQSSTSTEATALAQFWLRYGILEPPIISAFEVGLPATLTQWQTLLSLELLDRITFKRTPAVGSPFSRDLLINNIDFELTPKVWSMKINGSSRYTSVFTARDAIGVGYSSSTNSQIVKDAPEVRSVAVTAYNMNSATFYGEINAMGYSSTVKVQYSTDSLFGSYTEVTPTPSTVTGSTWTASSVSVSGLSNGTTYYFRYKATSSIGVTYGSGGGFTTYRLKQVAFGSSGTWTAPTWGGTTQTTAYNVLVVSGGGGHGGYQGGGGGGGNYGQSASITLSSSMTAVVGAGGGEAANGANSTLTNFASTVTAGSKGLDPLGSDPNGGAAGNGNGGGLGFSDLFGGDSAGGGGGGLGGGGGAYYIYGGVNHGGNGGAGIITGYYGLPIGDGGGGHAIWGSGTNGGSTSYAGGGRYGDRNGVQGIVVFQYYGPSGSRSSTGWSEVNA